MVANEHGHKDVLRTGLKGSEHDYLVTQDF
jgi:hypothetical protein